jgi:putative ABC transport system permease protein
VDPNRTKTEDRIVIARDLQHALRAMRKNPGVIAVAILALALGMGANTAIFSVVNSILLHPASLRDLRDPARIVMLWETMPGMSMPPFAERMPVAAANVEEWRREAHSFDGIAVFQSTDCNLSAGAAADASPERVEAIAVSPDFFAVTGIRPWLGRTFTADEARNSPDRVAMVSYELWHKRFGASRSLTGKTIRVNGAGRVIVGVLPEGFEQPGYWAGFEHRSPQVWTPVDLATLKTGAERWGLNWFVYARLKPGVTPAGARAELNVLFARVKKQQPDKNVGTAVNVFPLADEDAGPDMRTSVLALQIAVAFVLLIACANIANLLLARAVGRQRDLAIRLALGAGRARIARLLLTESLLLSLAGGLAGIILASWGMSAIAALAPSDSHGFHNLHLDAYVLGFTFLMTVVTAFLFGFAPALHASRRNLNEALGYGGRAIGGGPKWLRSGMVVGEVALAVILLAGAGLMIRSMQALMDVDLGYRTDHLLTAKIHVSNPQIAANPERQRAFCDRVLASVEHLPGVVSASISSGLPMADFTESNYNIEGQPKARDMRLASQSRVSEGFFRTLGMPLRRGRNFTAAEAEAAQPTVAIVSEAFANRNWPGQDALGKVLLLPNGNNPDHRLTIVGITGDTHQMGPDHEPVPAIFIPSHAFANFDIALRTVGDPAALTGALQHAVWQVDPQQPIDGMLSMQQRLHGWGDERRFYMAVLSLFAGLALLLAALGIYGVLAYVVSLRTREIGVRMALGAGRREVLRLVIGQGLRLTFAGAAIGIAGGLLLTRLMRSMVFGVSTSDPVTFIVAAAALLAATLLATYFPARRAARVDPIQALRVE